MSGRAAAACIDILAGLPKLLQYTLLQMAIFSDLHRSREITRLNYFVSMYSSRNNQPREKFITTCGNVPINFFIRLVKVLSPAILICRVLHQLQHNWLKTIVKINHNRDVKKPFNCRDWSKICTDPCKQAVQEQNLSGPV